MADIKLALEEKYEKEKVTEKKEIKEKTLCNARKIQRWNYYSSRIFR